MLRNVHVLVLIVMLFLVGCGSTSGGKTGDSTKDYHMLIQTANIMEIKEKMSIGKQYDIYADNILVATISGKSFNVFGDELIMKDANGKILAKEKEVKRWGLKFTRMAVITDAEDNITGYIGEELGSKLTNLSLYFHFIDANKNEVGVADQSIISLTRKMNFNGVGGDVDYKMKGNISLMDNYTLTKINKSTQIDPIQAIFMVCIQDAILDAKDAERSK